jgi:hypothetical protein
MNRALLTRIVFTAYLLLLLYKYFNGSLLGQQPLPLFNYPGLNFTYWLFILSGINTFLFNHNSLLILINSLLFVSCIGLIINPKLTYLAIVFTISIWLYQFLYFEILTYQTYAKGLLFPCIPFMFTKEFKFKLSFETGRYYLCGLYGLAGLLKIINGGVFHSSHLSDAIKGTVADFVIQNPSSMKAMVMQYFITHQNLSYALFISAVILESSFLIGFFTKKYDKFLLLLFFFFHFTNAYLMDIPMMNNFIIAAFLIPFAFNQKEAYTKFELSPH